MKPNDLFILYRQRHHRIRHLTLLIRLRSKRLRLLVQGRYLLPPPMFELVLTDIHGRRCQPGAFVPFIFKGDPAGHRLDKGILRAVLSVLRVFHKGIADPVDGPEVPQIERFKIPLHGFSSPRSRYESRVQIVGQIVKVFPFDPAGNGTDR